MEGWRVNPIVRHPLGSPLMHFNQVNVISVKGIIRTLHFPARRLYKIKLRSVFIDFNTFPYKALQYLALLRPLKNIPPVRLKRLD